MKFYQFKNRVFENALKSSEETDLIFTTNEIREVIDKLKFGVIAPEVLVKHEYEDENSVIKITAFYRENNKREIGGDDWNPSYKNSINYKLYSNGKLAIGTFDYINRNSIGNEYSKPRFTRKAMPNDYIAYVNSVEEAIELINYSIIDFVLPYKSNPDFSYYKNISLRDFRPYNKMT
jgi:hypothetical protein